MIAYPWFVPAALNTKSPKFIGRNRRFSFARATAFAVKSDRILYRMNYSCPEPKTHPPQSRIRARECGNLSADL
jgi:hypothetical protein